METVTAGKKKTKAVTNATVIVNFHSVFPHFFSFLPPVRTASLPCGGSSSCCQSFLPSVSIFLKSILPPFNSSSNIISLLFSLFSFLFFFFFALLCVNESRRQQIISKIGNNGEAVKNPDDSRRAIGAPPLRAPPSAAFILVFRFFQHKVTRDSQQLL